MSAPTVTRKAEPRIIGVLLSSMNSMIWKSTGTKQSPIRSITLRTNPFGKILSGVVSPTSGSVFVEKPKNFVFQNPDHQVVMPTVEADVTFGLGKYHDMKLEEFKSRVIKALEAVGMRDYMLRPIQTLSGGQKQRVAIAGALAEACKVLLLDELTTFLDQSDQMSVIKAVKELINAKKGEDVTALWVTHWLEELEYADGAVYMENGRIVRHGDAATILDFIKVKQSSYIDQIGS